MDNGFPAGPFFPATGVQTPLIVEYRGLFVPEPGTGLLVLTGLLGLAARRRGCA